MTAVMKAGGGSVKAEGDLEETVLSAEQSIVRDAADLSPTVILLPFQHTSAGESLAEYGYVGLDASRKYRFPRVNWATIEARLVAPILDKSAALLASESGTAAEAVADMWQTVKQAFEDVSGHSAAGLERLITAESDTEYASGAGTVDTAWKHSFLLRTVAFACAVLRDGPALFGVSAADASHRSVTPILESIPPLSDGRLDLTLGQCCYILICMFFSLYTHFGAAWLAGRKAALHLRIPHCGSAAGLVFAHVNQHFSLGLPL